MKATFIIPPVTDGNRPAERTAGCTRVVYFAPNIYELTVAAVVEQMGHEVEYHDFVYDSRTEADFVKWLGGDTADIYFIWTVNLSIETDVKAMGHIHELRPEAKVVVIGPGPTYFAERMLLTESDVVVRGEPELTVKELLERLESGGDWRSVAGTSVLADGRVRNNGFRPMMRSLDDLPIPARHLLGDRQFHNPKLKTGPYTTMVTSRNCPYQCIYCVPSSLTFAREIEYRAANGGKGKPFISTRSVENVDKEITLLAEQGYRAIGFMDDNFLFKWDEERTRAICASLKRHGIVWGCQARVDAITESVAKMLGESGCLYVDLGVESFDDRILQYVKKGITVADIYRAVEQLKRYNVPVKLNVLIGSSPLETRDTVKHTLREAKKLKVDQVMFNIVSPFPATEFYEQAIANHWIDRYVPTDVQRESILNLPHLSSREMERLLFWNNISYFLSWHIISTHLKKFTSWSEFTHALRALKVKLFG